MGATPPKAINQKHPAHPAELLCGPLCCRLLSKAPTPLKGESPHNCDTLALNVRCAVRALALLALTHPRVVERAMGASPPPVSRWGPCLPRLPRNSLVGTGIPPPLLALELESAPLIWAALPSPSPSPTLPPWFPALPPATSRMARGPRLQPTHTWQCPDRVSLSWRGAPQPPVSLWGLPRNSLVGAMPLLHWAAMHPTPSLTLPPGIAAAAMPPVASGTRGPRLRLPGTTLAWQTLAPRNPLAWHTLAPRNPLVQQPLAQRKPLPLAPIKLVAWQPLAAKLVAPWMLLARGPRLPASPSLVDAWHWLVACPRVSPPT